MKKEVLGILNDSLTESLFEICSTRIKLKGKSSMQQLEWVASLEKKVCRIKDCIDWIVSRYSQLKDVREELPEKNGVFLCETIKGIIFLTYNVEDGWSKFGEDCIYWNKMVKYWVTLPFHLE